jgi:dipicolinate synthase subunit A
MLKGLGADVYVSARRKESLAWIKLNGYTPIEHKNLINSGEFDIIFNTVPAQILDSHIMARIATGALIIDLASLPGGVDFESAKRMGIPTIHALSLPGKVAPKTSGEIIKNTIFNILEEEKA